MNQEVRENPAEEEVIIDQTKRGEWLRKEKRDQEGRLIWERKREYIDPERPDLGIKYDYEKNFTYNREGQLETESGKNLEGKSKGHEWKKRFLEYDSAGNLLLEEGEILEQGEDSTKPEKGHAWQARHYYKEGKWRGKIGKITKDVNPEKENRIWTEGTIYTEEMKSYING